MINRRQFALGGMAVMAFGNVATQGFQNSEVVPFLIIAGNKGRLLVYNPNVGPGHLIASIIANAGTDSSGNHYLAGITSYNPSTGAAAELFNGNASFYGENPALYAEPGFIGVGPGPAAHSLTLASPQIGTDNQAALLLTGSVRPSVQVTEGYFAVGGTSRNLIVWLPPSGDITGATDVANVNFFLGLPGVTVNLLPGTFWGNATVTGHESQYIRGSGRQVTFWNLVTSGIPAFQWTPANPLVFSTHGTGGILGVTIAGPSGSVNPSDGSIGVSMDSIYLLESDIEVINCQFGLLQSNAHFWSEGGRHFVVANGCTNPVVWQTAATGAATRTGSFDRSELTVVHVDTLNGSYGNAGVQLLAGAQMLGGRIKQIGNYGGTGQAGVYALAVTGNSPVGLGTSNMNQTIIEHALEYDGTGVAPGSILVGGASFIQAAGILDYVSFGPGSLTGSSPWQFAGSIIGDNTLISGQWQSITSGFAAGWSGSVLFRNNLANAGEVMLQVILSVANGSNATFGVTVCTLPAGFIPGNFKSFTANLFNGASVSPIPFQIGTAGQLQYVGVTTVAGATFQFTGQVVYTLIV